MDRLEQDAPASGTKSLSTNRTTSNTSTISYTIPHYRRRRQKMSYLQLIVHSLVLLVIFMLSSFIVSSTSLISSSRELSSPPSRKACHVQICNQEYEMAAAAQRLHHQKELEKSYSTVRTSTIASTRSKTNRSNKTKDTKKRNGRRRKKGKTTTTTTISPLGQAHSGSQMISDQPQESTQQNQDYCTQLYHYNQCMKSLNNDCRGNLEYHSVVAMIRKWMEQERCSGSHHKSRQGVRTAMEVLFKQEEERLKQEKEKLRIKRCIDAVKNYTFGESYFFVAKKTNDDSNLDSIKSPKNFVRQARIRSTHPSIYDTEEPVASSPSEEEEDDTNFNEEDERLIGKVMSGSEAALTAEELAKLYDRDTEPLICSIFGDPHLRTFKNEFESCRTFGAWPMVDHPLFAVQVTNSRNEGSKHHVSGVTKVTVVIKNFLICGVDHDLVYEASLDKEDQDREESTMKSKYSLPITFIDGSSSTRNSMVKVTARSDNEVCIQMDHIGVQVCVYHTDPSSFLNVIVKFKKMMTGEERRAMISVMEERSLCTHGCPSRERIDIQTILDKVGVLPQSEVFINNRIMNHSEECDSLQGYYYVACLFDVKMKGATREEVSVHKFMQEMDDISIVKRSLSLKSLMSLTSSSIFTPIGHHVILIPFLVAITSIWLYPRS